MARYEELVVWQKAMLLTKEAYRLSELFRADERFGLVAQLRRAAVSVPSNVAEGQGRLTKGEFRHFLGQARGSLFEMETQMQLAIGLAYVSTEATGDFFALSGEVARLLNGLIGSLREGG